MAIQDYNFYLILASLFVYVLDRKNWRKILNVAPVHNEELQYITLDEYYIFKMWYWH